MYRRWDGYEWTSELQPVPDARRERFVAHRESLLRLVAAADDVNRLSASNPLVRASEPPPYFDPGVGYAMAGVICALVGAWPVGLGLARRSRQASASRDLPRSRQAWWALFLSYVSAAATTTVFVVQVVRH